MSKENAPLKTQIRSPRGTQISCKGWHQEAAMRMLMNNLDPEVAEKPEQQIVYGGTGKAARKFANSITERELSALKTAIANKNQPRIAEMMKKFAEKYGAETGGAAAGAATQISDMMVND